MALTEIDHVGKNELLGECIDNCFEATQVCEWYAAECLGNEEMEKGARLCQDIADLAIRQRSPTLAT